MMSENKDEPGFERLIGLFEQTHAGLQREAGVSLTDSNIKSAIRQALGRLKDKPPKGGWTDEREKRIGALGVDLAVLCSIQKAKTADYLKVLLAVEDSLKTRREMYGHSRGYLDFLKRFIETGSLH